MHRLAFAFALLGLAAVARAGDPPVSTQVTQAPDNVSIQLTNLKDYPVTTTLDFPKLNNLKVVGSTPSLTVVLRPHERRLAAKLKVIDKKEPADWNYVLSWNTGPIARYWDMVDYALPYPSGQSYVVLQGFDGEFSHRGPERYCVDWAMPEGTPVLASRSGLVINTESSNSGNGGWEARDKANYVRVLHDDGTVGVYLHFQQGGIRVKEGARVVTGQLLGYSGNTGFSSQPHLHFGVFRNVDGHTQESIPVTFRTPLGAGVTLLQGRSYSN